VQLVSILSALQQCATRSDGCGQVTCRGYLHIPFIYWNVQVWEKWGKYPKPRITNAWRSDYQIVVGHVVDSAYCLLMKM